MSLVAGALGRRTLGWCSFSGIGGGRLATRTANGSPQELRLITADLGKALARLTAALLDRRDWRALGRVAADGHGCRTFDWPLGALRTLRPLRLCGAGRQGSVRIPVDEARAMAVIRPLAALPTVDPLTAITAIALVALAIALTTAGVTVAIAAPIAIPAPVTITIAVAAPVTIHTAAVVWAVAALAPRVGSAVHALLAEPWLLTMALPEMAVAAAVPLLSVLPLAMLALIAIPIGLVARLALEPLVARSILARLTGLEHARLWLVGAHADLRLLTTPGIVHAVVAHFTAGLERLARAGEAVSRHHPAGVHAFPARLLHLLLAVGQDDAVVVLGMLQVILCQHRVAGGERIPRQRHVLLCNLGGRTMDFLVRAIGLISTHQRILMMLALAALIVAAVVATATSAVLLSLPHGTLFSRV